MEEREESSIINEVQHENIRWEIAENKFFQNFYSPPKWLSSFIFIYRFWYFHVSYIRFENEIETKFPIQSKTFCE